MELRTGASVTVISEATLARDLADTTCSPLHLTDVKLHAYTMGAIPVVGKMMIKVQYQGQEKDLHLVVGVAGDGPSLLG